MSPFLIGLILLLVGLAGVFWVVRSYAVERIIGGVWAG